MSCDLILVVCSRSSSYYALLLRPLLCAFLWYSLSMLSALLDEWYLRVTGFYFPLYLTESHMLLLFLAASGMAHSSWYKQAYFGSADTGEDEDDGELQAPRSGFSSLCSAVLFMGGLGLLTGLSSSLRSISLYFMEEDAQQLVQGVGLLLLLALCLLLRQARLSLLLILSVLLVVAGVVCSSYEQAEGHWLGFVLAGLATAADVGSVVLVARLLHAHHTRHTPLCLMQYMSLPAAFLVLLLLLAWELPDIRKSEQTGTLPYFSTLLLVAAENCLYFLLTWSGYTLIAMTSALTFGMLAAARQVFVFGAALLFFRERLTLLNTVGASTLSLGLLLYCLLCSQSFVRLLQRCRQRVRPRAAASSANYKVVYDCCQPESGVADTALIIITAERERGEEEEQEEDIEDWTGI